MNEAQRLLGIGYVHLARSHYCKERGFIMAAAVCKDAVQQVWRKAAALDASTNLSGESNGPVNLP